MRNRFPSPPWFTRSNFRTRSRQIGAVLMRRGLGWLLHRGPGGGKLGFGEGHQARYQAEQLRLALIELGVTFVKVGQALSARYDLLPHEYIHELSKLQDEVPPMPFDRIEKVFEHELGRKPGEIFSEFDPNPIASASIGQVYAARLQNGEEVVVKIVRPGV